MEEGDEESTFGRRWGQIEQREGKRSAQVMYINFKLHILKRDNPAAPKYHQELEEHVCE